MNEFTHVFAVPGENNIIDVINPATGTGGYSNETLEQIRGRYPGAERFAYADWTKAKAASQDTPIAWTETTEETFDDMLNVLPPAIMSGGGFLVGEPWDHHALSGRPRFAGYCERFGKWFAASRPMTKEEFRNEMNTFKGY